MNSLALIVLFTFPAFTVSGQIARNIAIAMCLLCCHPKINKKLSEPGILLIAWFVWAIICSYFSDNFQMALFGYHRRFEGINTWILAIAFGWLFWRSSTLKRLFITCIAIMIICLGVMIYRPEIYGNIIFGHISIAAFVSVASAMLMANQPLFVLCTLPFIYLTQNRSIIIAISFALACYLALNWKSVTKKQWIILSVCALLALYVGWPKLKNINIYSFGTGARTQIAQEAIEAITLKPVMGYGIDTQSTILTPKKDEFREHRPNETTFIKIPFIVDRAHNFFLDILMQTGVIGLAIWLFILTRIVYRAHSYPSETNKACLCGVAAFIGFGMMNPAGIPAMFLACVCIFGIEKEQS